MGSAAARRFAIVAAMVLLAPVWCQPVARAIEQPGAAFLRTAAPTTAPGAAIRRNAPAGVWAFGTRPQDGRVLAATVLLALTALVAAGPWTSVVPVRAGPSPLVRRRHAISLRAPPLPQGV